MAILRELPQGCQRTVVDGALSDSDEAEEWVATDDGGFQRTKEAITKDVTAVPSTHLQRQRSWPHISMLALALAAVVVAVAAQRSQAFWCGARGIPLGAMFRAPGFGIHELPDLSGQTALITGANVGLGLEVAKQLSRANATVVLACRDAQKCEAAASAVRAVGGPKASARTLLLDLNDLHSVQRAASTFRSQLRSLHMLVNNAGVAAQFPTELTVDGVERTFQSNYLGHFHLTQRLLPILLATAKRERRPSRIVHLTSGAHRAAPPEGVPLNLETINGRMGGYARYGMAKLAALAFANELARRHPRHLRSNAVHPGVVATELLRKDNFAAMLGPVLGRLAWLVAQVPAVTLALPIRLIDWPLLALALTWPGLTLASAVALAVAWCSVAPRARPCRHVTSRLPTRLVLQPSRYLAQLAGPQTRTARSSYQLRRAGQRITLWRTTRRSVLRCGASASGLSTRLVAAGTRASRLTWEGAGLASRRLLRIVQYVVAALEAFSLVYLYGYAIVWFQEMLCHGIR